MLFLFGQILQGEKKKKPEGEKRAGRRRGFTRRHRDRVSNGTEAPLSTDTGGCWEADQLGGDVPPGSVRGAVGPGHCAHLSAVRALAAGADPAAVEPPLESDPGQREQPAAAEGVHGLAAGRRDFPLAVPGERGRDDTSGLLYLLIFTSVPKYRLPCCACV